jgi:hypothetical protein
MLTSRLIRGIVALTVMTLFACSARAAVTVLSSPAAFATPITTANFDAWADGTIANSLYSAQGVTLSLPAGGNMPVYDWAAIFRVTTSSPNVLAAIGSANTTFSTAIDANFASPITEVGAYMGNDQGIYDGSFQNFTLTLYDAGNNVVGSTTVTANQNTSVDQFLGLYSTIPFVRARFANTNWVTASEGLSAVLDDLTFSTVPEPTALTALLLPLCLFARRRRHP